MHNVYKYSFKRYNQFCLLLSIGHTVRCQIMTRVLIRSVNSICSKGYYTKKPLTIATKSLLTQKIVMKSKGSTPL